MSKNLASDRKKKTSAVSLIMSSFYSDRNLLFIHAVTAILQNLTTVSISSESANPILTLFIASIGKLRKYIFHDDEDTAESENVGGYLTLV